MSTPTRTSVVRGGEVLTPDGRVAADVVVTGDRIARLVPRGGDAHGIDDGVDVLDAAGLLVAPGFVDVQINGAHGIDLAGEPEALWRLGELLPRYGVTAFCPTIITSPPEIAERAIAAIGSRPDGFVGAEPVGLHLEGPMLNPARKGAHPEALLRRPGLDVIDGWSRATGVTLVTLAPELPGALGVIRALAARGVTVSAGHTDATADELRAGLDAGVSAVTHLFNAMAPLHHREPGPIGVTLADRRVTAGLIADGIHVDPLAVAAAFAALGPARTMLVTDAVGALGLPPGTTRLGGATVTIGPDGVRLPDGTLAGSDLAMDVAVRNLIAFTGCTAADALTAATATPARLLGLATRGRIAPGARADLALLDADLSVVATVVGGRVVHHVP